MQGDKGPHLQVVVISSVQASPGNFGRWRSRAPVASPHRLFFRAAPVHGILSQQATSAKDGLPKSADGDTHRHSGSGPLSIGPAKTVYPEEGGTREVPTRGRELEF